MKKIHIIDSHTGGEPTRVIIDGGPELGGGSVARQLNVFREQFDHYRSATVCEPRGSDVLVGALACTPVAPDCVAGVIFFNNVGYLGMCGHGMIGFIATLAHQKKNQRRTASYRNTRWYRRYRTARRSLCYRTQRSGLPFPTDG